MSFLIAENLSLQFGGLKAVDQVNFAVEKGEIFTIIGPNGAGKTSIFNLISRLLQPDLGAAVLRRRGHSPTAPPHRIAKHGHRADLPEHRAVRATRPCWATFWSAGTATRTTNLVQELLFLPARAARRIRPSPQGRAGDRVARSEPYRDKLISGLPYGVRKVIELARALCSEPKLMLLDEPSSGLNVEETDDMSFWIRDIRSELGITVLMVEHDMSLVSRVSDRVLALNYGRELTTGTPAEVQSHPEVVAAYLGT